MSTLTQEEVINNLTNSGKNDSFCQYFRTLSISDLNSRVFYKALKICVTNDIKMIHKVYYSLLQLLQPELKFVAAEDVDEEEIGGEDKGEIVVTNVPSSIVDLVHFLIYDLLDFIPTSTNTFWKQLVRVKPDSQSHHMLVQSYLGNCLKFASELPFLSMSILQTVLLFLIDVDLLAHNMINNPKESENASYIQTLDSVLFMLFRYFSNVTKEEESNFEFFDLFHKTFFDQLDTLGLQYLVFLVVCLKEDNKDAFLESSFESLRTDSLDELTMMHWLVGITSRVKSLSQLDIFKVLEFINVLLHSNLDILRVEQISLILSGLLYIIIYRIEDLLAGSIKGTTIFNQKIVFIKKLIFSEYEQFSKVFIDREVLMSFVDVCEFYDIDIPCAWLETLYKNTFVEERNPLLKFLFDPYPEVLECSRKFITQSFKEFSNLEHVKK
ncbi:hypothetical protein PCE1_000578 [Barthelona sp. PCE]